MYYKYHGVHGWVRGSKVILPDNTEMNAANHEDWQYPVDGWEWYDNPLQEYLDWLASLDEIETEE